MNLQTSLQRTSGRFALLISSLLLGGGVGCSGDAGAGSSAPSTASGVAASSGGTGGDSGVSCPASSSTPIQLDTPTGTLFGTLELPSGCGPFPAVLFHAGSGPTDRDGNNAGALKTDCTKLLAEALASHAIASVRYDKRGIAASAAAGPKSEADYTLDMYVSDAAAWVSHLEADPRFKGISLAGHSEGSLIGMLAAQKSPVKSFISLEGPGRPAGDVLRTQLAAATLPAALLAEANHLIDELEAGRTVMTVSPALQSIFRPSVQPYLISWFAHDPAKEVAKLSVPILIVQGTTDIQVGVSDADLLVAAAPQSTRLVIPGMSHVFKAATSSPESQQKAYTDPTLPIVQGLIDGVVAFMAARR